MAQKHESGFQIAYVTFTDRSVFLGVLLILALIALVMLFAFPSRLEGDEVEVTGGRTYHLQISQNAFFTQASVVFDKSLSGSQITLALPEGSCYRVVETVGENGKESVESPKNRFSLIPKVSSKASIRLELGDFLQHGHAIKVKWTELGARVMVNGQEAVVNPNGRSATSPAPCRVETT